MPFHCEALVLLIFYPENHGDLIKAPFDVPNGAKNSTMRQNEKDAES